MRCADIRDILPAYLEGEVEGDQAEAVAGHLRVCESCRNFELDLGNAWTLLDTWEDAAPPPVLMRQVRNASRGPRTAVWVRIVLPVAAALLIVVGIAVRLGLKGGEVIQPPSLVTSELSSRDESMVNEDEIIADLQILQDTDFFESVDEMVKIDYLPLLDAPVRSAPDDSRSSLDMVFS